MRQPRYIRASKLLASLRADGEDQAVEQIEKACKVSRPCPVHGVLPDPILLLVRSPLGEGVIVGCPQCAPDHFREQWEKEGADQTRNLEAVKLDTALRVRVRQVAQGGSVRLSSVLRRLRETGHPEDEKDLRDAEGSVGHTCPVHGKLSDPIVVVAIVTPSDGSPPLGRYGFGCPDCSSPEVKRLWDEEGRQILA